MAGELESESVALERVREYEELPQVLSSCPGGKIQIKFLMKNSETPEAPSSG